MDEKLLATGGFVGASGGVVIALYNVNVAAPAAVAVRPALADVGPVSAFASGHLIDWLYYTFPMAMTVATVVFTAVAVMLAALLIE